MPARALLLFGLLLLLPAVASAQTHTTITAQQFAELVTELGFPNPQVDEDGDVIVTMQGYRVMFLIGSYQNRAISPRFAIAGTSATLGTVNQWNSSRRFSRAFLDGDGDPVLAADLDLDGGVQRDNIKEFVKLYNSLLGQFIAAVAG